MGFGNPPTILSISRHCEAGAAQRSNLPHYLLKGWDALHAMQGIASVITTPSQ